MSQSIVSIKERSDSGVTTSVEGKRPESRLEQLQRISSIPSFHHFLPGYLQYWENRPRPEEPYVHGTGSYALSRILSEGIRIQGKDDQRLVGGESAALGIEGLGFISLAKETTRGEQIARAYGFSSSRADAVQFNADEYFGNTRFKRIGESYGDIKGFVERQIATRINMQNIEDEAELREVFTQEAGILLQHGFNYGSYIISPDKIREKSSDLQALREEILNEGLSDPKEIRARLYRHNILRHHLDRDILKEVEIMRKYHADPDKGESWLERTINKRLKSSEEAIEKYNARPIDEITAVRSQFPVVLLIEGKGLDIDQREIAVEEEKRTYSNIGPEKIVEIRVPESNIPEVERMLAMSGLNVIVSPLEYYEVNEVVRR